jgi:hypothetical protein
MSEFGGVRLSGREGHPAPLSLRLRHSLQDTHSRDADRSFPLRSRLRGVQSGTEETRALADYIGEGAKGHGGACPTRRMMGLVRPGSKRGTSGRRRTSGRASVCRSPRCPQTSQRFRLGFRHFGVVRRGEQPISRGTEWSNGGSNTRPPYAPRVVKSRENDGERTTPDDSGTTRSFGF